ncbi:loganic acid O-methyltransferase-like [Pyrus communis]|uniref:loganic acid O-methyltransferase-like n=1 Tax=Pyrus communis TaxID=23211 RepID=UPI0035BF6641
MKGESFAMNGEDGLNSYKKNSKLQALDNVGPNTFACVQTIVEAVKLKFKNQLPELHVFFNDHVANEFNTLFKAFLIDRTYMVARVPGSFHGQLIPKASMNLMHTAFCVHWLRRVPEQVTKVGSCTLNKGRISYVSSSDEVVEAFGAQFESDAEGFFAARSAELVDDTFECLGCALADMAKEKTLETLITTEQKTLEMLIDLVMAGLVSDDLLDSFNVPIYIPSPSEIKRVVLGMKHLISIERLEELYYTSNLSTPDDVRGRVFHIRATIEGILVKHFLSELNTNELFERYIHKIE